MQMPPESWQAVASATTTALLADLNSLLASPLDAQAVRLHTRPLACYALVDLYELETTPTPSAAAQRAYVLWTPGVVVPLPEPARDILALNRALLPLNGFILTEANAVEYLHFLFGLAGARIDFCRLLDKPVFYVPEATASLPRGIKTLYQPPAWQQHTEDSGVIQLQLSVANRKGIYENVELTPEGTAKLSSKAVAGTCLLPPLREHEVYQPFVFGLTAEQLATQRSQLLQLQEQRVARVRQSQQAATSAFKWHSTEPATHRLLLQAAAAQCVAAFSAVEVVSRVARLSFYEVVDLYELELIGDEQVAPGAADRRTYVLWTGAAFGGSPLHLFQPLNWTNTPIYAMNALLARAGLLRIHEETITDYLHFFFNLVKGKHGFFQPVTDGVIKTGDSTEKAYELQVTLQPEELLVSGFRAWNTLIFQDNVFEAWGYAQRDGEVSLEEEEHLGGLYSHVEPVSEFLAGNAAAPLILLTSDSYKNKSVAGLKNMLLASPDRIAQHVAKELGWREHTAALFLTELRTSNTAYRKHIVTEAVRISDKDLGPDGRIRLVDCYFTGLVELTTTGSNLEFSAERCFFQGGIQFGKNWAGSINLNGCKLFRPKDTRPRAQRAVRGDASNSSTTPQHALLSLADVTRATTVRLLNSWVERGIRLKRLSCRLVDLDNCWLPGYCKASRLNCESLELRNSWLEGELQLDKAICGYLALAAPSISLLDLRAATIAGQVEIEALYSGALEAANLKCGNLTITGLGWRGSLQRIDLSYLQAASVKLSGLYLREACLLDRANIALGLTIEGTFIGDRLSATNMTVERDIIFIHVDIGRECDLSGSQIARALKFKSWFGSAIDQGIRIGRDLNLERVQAGHVTLAPCLIGRKLYAQEARFASFSYLSGLVSKNKELQLLRSRVQEDVYLDGTIVAGDFRWIGVDVGDPAQPGIVAGFNASRLQVGGNLYLTDSLKRVQKAIIGYFTSYSGSDGERLHKKMRKQARSLPDWATVTASTFSHGLCLRGVAVAGDLNASLTRIGHDLLLEFGQIGGSVKLLGTTIGHRLTMTRCRVQHHVRLGQHERTRASILRTVNLTALAVEGSLHFSGVDCGGSVELADATLKGGLTTVLHNSPASGLQILGSLNLRSATAQDDLNLTGLVLGPDGAQEPAKLAQADASLFFLEACDLVVEGTLWLSPDFGQVSRSAQIPGSIDLARAKLRQLILLNKSTFDCLPAQPMAAGHPAAPIYIKLEDAQIGTLASHQPAPRPLLLRGLVVQAWNLNQEASSVKEATAHVAFLAQTTRIQRALYRAVEERYYNEGNVGASKVVYQGLWDRENEERPRFWRGLRKIGYAFFNYFADTPPGWAWFVLGVWLLVSSLFFANPAHVMRAEKTRLATSAPADAGYTPALAPAASSLGYPWPLAAWAAPATAAPAAEPENQPANWRFWDGFWVALRYHIPILPVLGRSAWVASDQPGSWGVSPDGYAGVVALLNWGIVPIFVLLTSQAIVRRARK